MEPSKDRQMPPRRLKTSPRRLQDASKTPRDTSKTRFWWIFGIKMEPSWHQNRIWKQSYVKRAWKAKNIIFPIEFNDFWRFGDWFSDGKSNTNQLKDGTQDGMPQFSSLLPGKSNRNAPQDAPRRPKTPLGMIVGRFLIDFWTVFGWFLVESGGVS